METHLLEQGRFKDAIVACFNTAKINAFDPNLLEPLLKVLRLSPSLAADLAQAEMYSGAAQKLTHKKAVVRLNLLRLVRNIIDNSDADMGVGTTPMGRQHLAVLFDAVQKLADMDSAVLVRNLASELVRSHINVDPDTVATAMSSNSVSMTASSSRTRPSALRRTTLYTPPSLQSSVSAPLTPTRSGGAHLNPRHSQYNQYRAQHQSQSSLSSASPALVEVAATHRRSAVALAHERDALAYRPRSRDGVSVGSSIPRRVSGDSSSGSSSISSMNKASGIGSASSSSLASLGSGSGSASSTTPTGNGGGLSRLPRQPSGSHQGSSRSGLGPAIVSRSDSSMSNKENVIGRYWMAGGLGPSALASSGTDRMDRPERVSAVGSGMGGGYGSSGGGSSSRASMIAASNSAAGGSSRHAGGADGQVKASGRRRTRAPSTDVKWT